MKQAQIIFSMLTLFLVIGCSNTLSGMKEDSAENSRKTAASAENLASGVQEAGKDISASTQLTPKITTAIASDQRLNLPANVIDVNSTNESVTLSGHVTSTELKQLAEEVAQKAMTDAKAQQALINNLTLKP